jgi:hypothetical protein
MLMLSILYWYNTLNVIVMVLAHKNYSHRVDKSLDSYTIAWFQSFVNKHTAVSLAEKLQIPML